MGFWARIFKRNKRVLVWNHSIKQRLDLKDTGESYDFVFHYLIYYYPYKDEYVLVVDPLYHHWQRAGYVEQNWDAKSYDAYLEALEELKNLQTKPKKVRLVELEEELKRALDEENFEEAGRLRDLINKIKNGR